MATHNQQTIEALSVVYLDSLRGEKLDDVDGRTTFHIIFIIIPVIGIDEGQFYPDCIEFAEEMAAKGKIVIIAALDGDYRRKSFNKITDLVPLAENGNMKLVASKLSAWIFKLVIKLSAVCQICGKDAAFTKRVEQQNNQLELIGGADAYLAVCRKCFQKKGDSKLISHSEWMISMIIVYNL